MRHLVPRAPSVAAALLWPVPGVRRLRRVGARARQGPPSGFIERLLDTLRVTIDLAPGATRNIPRHGPLVVAVNHPTGILDGLVAAAVVRRVRPDVRVLANVVLSVFPEARETCCFVDPFGWKGSGRRSFRGLRAASRWLRQGGALVVFPAGEVSHVGADGDVRDRAWTPTIGRLGLGAGAATAVMHLGVRPSDRLVRAARVHPWLRTCLLFGELLRQRGAAVRVTVAVVERSDRGHRLSGPAETARLRAALDALANGSPSPPAPRPIAPAASAAGLQADIDRLDPSRRLITSGSFSVYRARAVEIPRVLDEIGRLREVTFRAVGEGTGRSRDLDRFDGTYHHLFVWNHETREIVGAYRAGFVEELTRTRGVDGLYSRTLFTYDDRLLRRLGPAIELGRSFVRPEYQRHHLPLMLLWQGIGRLVAREPRHRVLFGLVSISSRYSSTTRRLLIDFLRANHMDQALAELVRASSDLPPALRSGDGVAPVAARSLDDVSRVMRTIEADGRDVPVLLRQYLKLNARLLGFNVDPDFGDALDGLLMVDLTDADRRILNRVLGRVEASRFLAYHDRAARQEARPACEPPRRLTPIES